MIYSSEAIIVVQEPDLAIIQKELVDVCEFRIKLDFVTIPPGEDWGTADTLRHIKDKLTTVRTFLNYMFYHIFRV